MRETGLGFPDINTLEPLAAALDVSLMELMNSQRGGGELSREQADRAVSEALGLPTREIRGHPYYDLRSANLATAHSGLSRELKGRHLQMIAIGGSIGTLSRGCDPTLVSGLSRPMSRGGSRLAPDPLRRDAWEAPATLGWTAS